MNITDDTIVRLCNGVSETANKRSLSFIKNLDGAGESVVCVYRSAVAFILEQEITSPFELFKYFHRKFEINFCSSIEKTDEETFVIHGRDVELFYYAVLNNLLVDDRVNFAVGMIESYCVDNSISAHISQPVESDELYQFLSDALSEKNSPHELVSDYFYAMDAVSIHPSFGMSSPQELNKIYSLWGSMLALAKIV